MSQKLALSVHRLFVDGSFAPATDTVPAPFLTLSRHEPVAPGAMQQVTRGAGCDGCVAKSFSPTRATCHGAPVLIRRTSKRVSKAVALNLV